jgi:hypothetical protein
MTLFDWDDNGGGGCNHGPLVVPSPIAPWHRPPLTPNIQTLITDGTVDLSTSTTFLAVSTPKSPVSNFIATIPNGQWNGQVKTVIIPPYTLPTTQTWTMNGIFASFQSLTFNSIGFSAVLQWVGTSPSNGAWVLLAGNAVPNPS